mgnify:CR=1 FL=1
MFFICKWCKSYQKVIRRHSGCALQTGAEVRQKLGSTEVDEDHTCESTQ